MKKYYPLILVTLISSCGLTLTENEDKGFNDALNFYGGQCSYSIGVEASTKDENSRGKYFKLELSKSEALKKYEEKPEMVTSTMAYKFFSQLNKEERNNYSFIRGALLYDDGKTIEHDYTINELETVEKKLEVVRNVVATIKERRFERFHELLNPQDVFRYEKQGIIDNLIKYDSTFGNVTGLELMGFKFTRADEVPVLSIFGMVMRDRQNNQLRVWLNPNQENNQILGVNYEW
jgi:hypothetical protein